VSFAVITLCVASQLMFIVVVYFVMDSVRKLFDTPSLVNELKVRVPIFGHFTHNTGHCALQTHDYRHSIHVQSDTFDFLHFPFSSLQFPFRIIFLLCKGFSHLNLN
jgi:hypothetical protein